MLILSCHSGRGGNREPQHLSSSPQRESRAPAPVIIAAAGIQSPSPRLSRRSENPEPQPPSFSPQRESRASIMRQQGFGNEDAAGGRPYPRRHLPQRNLQYKKWAAGSRPGGNLGGETGRISPNSWPNSRPNTSASSAGPLRGRWSWLAPA